MKILITLLLVLSLFGVAEAKRRRKRAHYVPVEIIKDHGNGRFDIEERLPEIKEFLEDEGIRARMGQGEIHNRFGYVHLNAIDVAVSPRSSKGKKLINFLRSKLIPFLSISGAKKGISTGPHVHIGFASPKTIVRYPVGTINGKVNSFRCPFGYILGVCF
jgi:hypothetical protein